MSDSECNNSLRVLHAPTPALYQPSLFVRGLREHGVHTDLMYADRNFLEYSRGIPDAIILDKADINSTALMDFLIYALKTYNIFHFHSGYSLLPWHFYAGDLRLLKKIGKVIFMSRWGCRDGRTPSDFLSESQFCYSCPVYQTSCTDEIIRKRLLIEEEYVDVVINHECDFRGFNRSAIFLHGSIDLEFWRPTLVIPAELKYPPKTKNEIRILHAVGGANRGDVKGSNAIRHVMEKLKKGGLNIEYRALSGISFQDLRFHILQADIIIDQLRYGSFGSFARESLSLGKPVVGHVLESQRQLLKGLPVIEATASTLEKVVTDLIRDPERLVELGRLSRVYAEKHFDYRKITLKLKNLYEQSYWMSKQGGKERVRGSISK